MNNVRGWTMGRACGVGQMLQEICSGIMSSAAMGGWEEKHDLVRATLAILYQNAAHSLQTQTVMAC